MYLLGKRLAFLLMSALLVIGVTIGGASSSFADATANADVATYHYVAFGDSITVGYEPGMDENSISYGFVDRLYEQALYTGRTKLNNYGMMGLTSEGLRNYLQVVSEGNVVTADAIQVGIPDPRMNQILNQVDQTRDAVMSADLITITIGGNDMSHFQTLLDGKT